MRIELTKGQLDVVLSILREKGEIEMADLIEISAQSSEPFDLRLPTEVHIPDPQDITKTLNIKTFNSGFAALAWCMDQIGSDQLGRFQLLRPVTNLAASNSEA